MITREREIKQNSFKPDCLIVFRTLEYSLFNHEIMRYKLILLNKVLRVFKTHYRLFAHSFNILLLAARHLMNVSLIAFPRRRRKD